MRICYFAPLIGIALFAAPALAQDMPANPPAPAPGGYGTRDPLARMDINGDGIISRDEIVADADRRFDRFDLNHDGRITQDEVQARMADMERRGAASPTGDSPPPRRPGSRMGAGMIRRADANGDGVVTREEFRAAELQRFAMMDANHDGNIDANERAAAAEAMGGHMGGHGAGRRPAPGGDMPPPSPASPDSSQ